MVVLLCLCQQSACVGPGDRGRVHVPFVGVVVVAVVVVVVVVVVLLTVRVRMSVIIVAVSMAVAMIMTMVMMSKRCHAHEIDSQAHAADNEELRQALRLVALSQTLNGLHHNLNTDQHQKYAVSKPRQTLNLPKTVGKALGRRPFRGHGCEEPECQGDAVEEHMNAVAQQPK
jgi:hypothetical protein